MHTPNAAVAFAPFDPAAMSGLEFLTRLREGRHPAPPFSAETQIWIAEVERGRVLFEATPSLRFFNPLGVVHGGWISTLLDSAMGCAVHLVLQPGQAYTTADMMIHFVHPVRETTGTLSCEGKIVHAGGRIATAEGRAWDQAGNLMAHGSETCLIFRAQSPTA
jgi:uncharacterized protein (TIGR00369 family)